jgi:hypothetical protein
MWLLAAALPLQGVSAATMLACGARNHEHASSTVATHSHAGHLATVHGHFHAADASAGHDSGSEVSHPVKTDLAKGVAHKCSACASCCLNFVVPTEAVVFDRVKLPDLFAPLVARALAAYVTEGLERPPRLFLA